MITLLTPSNKVSDAIKEYSAAVNAGNVEAMTYLAECYEDGLGGLEIDDTKAWDLYMNAAQKGYAPAEYSIACWLDDDDDDLYNPEEAYVWIKRAAEHQYAPALVYLAGDALQQDNYDEAYCYLLKAIDGLGEREEAFSYLFTYSHNYLTLSKYTNDIRGFDKPSPEDMYNFALNSGENAFYNLGICYHEGIGVEKNNDKALFFLKLIAEQEIDPDMVKTRGVFLDNDNILHAQEIIGEIFLEEGRKDEALEWYTKSAKAGNPEAQECLAEAYRWGKEDDGVEFDVDKNLELSYLFYEMAANQFVDDEIRENAMEIIKNWREFIKD